MTRRPGITRPRLLATAPLALVLVLAAAPLDAQPRHGVTLYRDLDLSGFHETFDEDVRDLSRTRFGNDHATSVAVSRGCRARLYEHADFRGRHTDVTGRIRDLRGSQVGNDRVSSLKVRCDRDPWDDDDPWDDGDGGLTLYRDLRFTGVSETFTRDVADLRGTRIGDDRATSARVSPGCTARLYQHPDFRGGFTEVRGEEPDLRGSRVGDDGASSVQVRCRRGGGGGFGVTLHRDLRFTGISESFTGDVRDLRGSRIGDDQATSVSVPPGCRVRLYQHPDFRGDYTELRADEPDLRGSRVGDDGASSLRVWCR